MRNRPINIRYRILGACLLIGMLALSTFVLFGWSFRSLLRSRAEESCVRMAQLLADHGHDRLLALATESQILADALSRLEHEAVSEGKAVNQNVAYSSLICSWAVYDPIGRRVGGGRAPRLEQELEAAGLGTLHVVPRERERMTEALKGHSSTVLVPSGERCYAVIYRPIHRPGKPSWALQIAAQPILPVPPLSSTDRGAQLLLRPFTSSSGTPHVVEVSGQPRMVVERPLAFGGRCLGTVAVAVTYGNELKCEQGLLLTLGVVTLAGVGILITISYQLTDVAMVPLQRIRDFIVRLQSGGAVERPEDLFEGEAGAILGAYRDLLDKSQDWADHAMEANRSARDLLLGACESLVGAIEAKDEYTAGHSQRVAEMACCVARELGWDSTLIVHLRLGAVLHDMGKVGVPEAILSKPAELTTEEMDTVREHPVIGARILSSLPGCEGIVRTVLHHHERYDGAGYPTGVAGDDIPISARIVAIADVYDALTSERSYRRAYAPQEAIAILESGRGTAFDPEILEVALCVVRRDLDTGDSPGRSTKDRGEAEAIGVATPPPAWTAQETA